MSRRPVGKKQWSGTAWVLGGYAGRLGFQLVAFILLARALGVAGFGIFAGTLALVNLLAPFVEFGGYSLVVRDVADGVPTGRALGNSLLVLALAAPLALSAMAAAKPVALPDVPWALVLAVAASEFTGKRITNLVIGAHVATGRLWRNAVLETGRGAVQLLMVLLLLLARGDVVTWGLLFLTESLLTGMAALAWAARQWGVPTARWREARTRWPEGVHFGAGLAAETANNDVDKAMLARLATFEATGLYTAAYRFIAVARLPIHAFLSAVYPRFFQAGRSGLAGARDVARDLLPWTAAYGLVAGSILWLGAPLLPLLLGPGFEASTEALRLLAVVPLIQGVYAPFADALTGSGMQPARTRGQLWALALNVALNVWLILRLSWRGAIIATLASEVVLGVFLVHRAGRAGAALRSEAV